jgi:AcrR family transcriptional regulator
MPAARPATPSRPNHYHHGDLRRALLNAALEESAASGPQNLSFRELARKLGVTTAAPYHHFRDKTELLLLLATEGFTRLLERSLAAAQTKRTPAGKIEALTRAYLEFGRRERGYYQIMFFHEVSAQCNVPELDQAAEQCFHLVCDAITRSNPRLGPTAVTQRAISVWSFLHGLLELSISGTLAHKLRPKSEDKIAIEVVRRIINS